MVCAMALKRVAEVYLRDVGTSHDVVNKLNSRFDQKIMRKYDSVDQSGKGDKRAALLHNAKRFRKDRAFIWDLLEETVHDYFNDYSGGELPVALGARRSSDAVQVIVKATRKFVTVLGDTQTSSHMRKYWTGKI